MRKWNRNTKGSVFSDKQRERIKDKLFEIFEDNQVAVVEVRNGELKPHTIWAYTLRKAKIR